MQCYDLHGVSVDEQLATCTINEVMKLKDQRLRDAGKSVAITIRDGSLTPDAFTQMIQNECEVCPASVNVEVQRRLLTKKEVRAMNITYQLIGHGSRVNLNSNDNSVIVVEVSEEQVFSRMRQDITGGVSAGDEREVILERLSALEKAGKTPSFAQRYAEFMGVAADHSWFAKREDRRPDQGCQETRS